jgi:hypothetical protein
MRFANPKPCEIPNVGRYITSRDPNRTEAGIAYFHEDVAQGTLHFADTSCKTFDLEIENARLPLGETERTVIVWAGGDLLEVDPAHDVLTTLSSDVTNVITRAFSGRTLVVAGDRLQVFGADWKSQGSFGRGIGSVVKTQTGVLYLDRTGLRRLSAGSDSAKTKDELIAADACQLGMRDDTWATFLAPCSDARLHARSEPSGKLYDLELDADPAYLRLLPARDSPGKDPTADPFWFLFLRNVSSGVGTFVLRDPKGVEHVIGENATLDHFAWNDSSTDRYGYALVNMADGLGDYVYFDANGKTHALAHRVYSGAQRLIVDWDGSVGNLAVASGDRLVVVTERVPNRAFEFSDSRAEWTVLFHDWQGDSGRLSRFPGTLDALARTPNDAPFASPELVEVAPSVGVFTTASLGSLLPGTIFLADYDAQTDTGRLAYENAELRFKATVDVGVSDYLVTSSDLIYCIPKGPGQGIWLASGK